MTRKKILFRTIVIISVLLLGLFILLFYRTSNTYTAASKAEINIKASALLNTYLSDEKKANNLYTNKLIKVSGVLKDITYLNNRTTVILENAMSSSGIICELNQEESSKLEKLEKGKKVKVMGICKGFLKDVILLNCYLEINE